MSISRRLLVAIALLLSAPALASAATISLAWNANTESDLAGYVLVYGTSPGVYSTSIDVGPAIAYSVPSLSPGTRYYFAVRAYNTAGESSPLSAEVSDVAADPPPPPDTTAPAVSVTAPAAGATLAGTVTVSASASDNIGVAGVQFTIDGVNAGAEDTTAPYTLAWNTTSVANGGHQVAAVARDAAGNRTTAAAVAVNVSNVTTPPPGSGLVAAYGFEEGAGTLAGDTSGQANHGSISGATWNSAGRFGKALGFDGAGDWVTVADVASLDLTGAMTLEAWVYPTAAADGTVIAKESAGGVVYALYSYDNAPAPIAYLDAGGYWSATGTAQLPLSAWSHLAATYDGTTLRLFVNGALVGSRVVGNSILTSAGALRIGGNSLWGEYFQGRIDEVRVYNRALSASEIAADMSVAVVTAPADTTAPTVSVTAPAAGATLAGTVTVSASASDNVGVAGVQFTVDGANAGVEDTTAPYTLAWNTTAVANGGHQVAAVARDAAGNRTTAAAVAVTVSNDTTPPTVTGVSPAAGAANVPSPLTVTATFSEPVNASSVNTSTFELRNGAGALIAATVSYDATTRTATLATSAVFATAQTCTAVVKGGAGGVRDIAGNALASDVTWSFTVSPPPGAGLVAAYGFEEDAGTVAGDTSGSANHGSISGATWNTAGRFGKALKFDGIDDWVTVPDASSLDLTNGMTLEAWVYPTAAADGTVIAKESAGGVVYALYSYDNAPTPVAYIDATSYWSAAGTAQLPLNAWSHLAATYDGTTLRLFVNGTLVSSRVVGNSILTSAGALRIGGNSLWGEYFQGRIDEVRIYNRALSAAEVAGDMNRPVSNLLMLAYAFDEGSGNSALDESGRGHTGAVSGATWAASGRFGGALRFDGVDDMVTAADADDLDLAAALTIEAWVYPTSVLTDWRTAVLKETVGGLAYALYAHSDTAGAQGEANIGGVKRAADASSIPPNSWTHLAVTYDGAALRLFVNGVMVSTTPATGSVMNSAGALRVGGNTVWGEYFEGLIDEVRIYKRALSAAEIQTDMTTPIKGPQ